MPLGRPHTIKRPAVRFPRALYGTGWKRLLKIMRLQITFWLALLLRQLLLETQPESPCHLASENPCSERLSLFSCAFWNLFVYLWKVAMRFWHCVACTHACIFSSKVLWAISIFCNETAWKVSNLNRIFRRTFCIFKAKYLVGKWLWLPSITWNRAGLWKRLRGSLTLALVSILNNL